MTIILKVNGKEYELNVPPSKRLLDVLRDDLGLTGTKYGCGTGECGACTVLVDGKPSPSCIMLAAQAEGMEITTIEGVRNLPIFEKIENAFAEFGAVQCGYCTPAMVLNTIYLLNKNEKPSREEIRSAISGVYCRCGCYQKIIDAIESIVDADHKNKIPHENPVGIVGAGVQRIDVKEKIEGRSIYAIDLKPIGMRRYDDLLYLKFLKSPFAHAKIKSIDVEEAMKQKGVELILTHENVPDVHFTTAGQTYPEPSPYDTRLLNDKVRYLGEPVAIVAAESEEICERAIALIKVQYEPLKAVFDPEEALEDGAPKIHDQGNLIDEMDKEIGSVEEGFKEADVIIERDYETQIQKHIHLEPWSSLTHLEGNKLQVETTNQVVFHVRRILSRVLDLPMSRIGVKSMTIGGGFGGKQELCLEAWAGFVTLKTGRPVFVSLSREEQFYISRRRHSAKMKVKIGAKKSGELTAILMDVITETGAYGSHAITVTSNIGSMTLPLYSRLCKDMRLHAKVTYTNKPIAGAFRGYGTTQGTYALECAMDELAEKLEMDPIDLRLKNIIREGDVDPISEVLTEGGKAIPRVIKSCGIEECLKKGREIFRWDEKRRSGKKGIGLACGMKGSGVAGYELASSMVKLNEDGTILVTAGASDLGQGSNSAMAQIAAESVGVKLEDVEVVSADTDKTLFDMGTYACSVTYVTGNAVERAASELKRKIIELVSKNKKLEKKRLDIKDGKISVDGKFEMELKEIAMDSVYGEEREQLVGIGSAEDLISPPPFTAHFVELDVDKETGKVKILRYLNLTDIGTIINPVAAEGQVQGAILQGIGYALFEEMKFDAEGRILNPDLTNYKIPSALDAVDIETYFVKTYEPTGPYGAKSVGEICNVSVAPAIANAIYAATGMRFRKLPISREKIAMAEKEKEERIEEKK